MMQITRAEIIAVTLLIHQSLLTVPPASLNFAIRLSALYSGQYNQRPAVKPRYCCGQATQPDVIRSIIGKTPRSLICCGTQRHDFSERSLSGQAACGRHHATGKKLVASGACWLSFGFSVTSLRG